MKKFILFKSPTCGPCRMFAPILKSIAEEYNYVYEEVDVTTMNGLEIAQQYNITHSGAAVYIENDEIKFTWDRPCPAVKIKTDLHLN